MNDLPIIPLIFNKTASRPTPSWQSSAPPTMWMPSLPRQQSGVTASTLPQVRHMSTSISASWHSRTTRTARTPTLKPSSPPIPCTPTTTWTNWKVSPPHGCCPPAAAMHFLWDAEIRGYGDTEIRRGTLERVPEPPELSSNCIWLKPGGGEGVSRAGGGEGMGNRFSLPPLSRRETCPVGRLPTLPLVCFLALPSPKGRIDHPPSPVGKGETKVILCKGLRPLHPRGWAECGTESGGMRRPAEACPGRHGQVNSGSQTRQKRLSRFCNTRHSSRHAGAQEKAGTGHERRIPSIIICSEKFWGVWGLFQESPSASRAPQRFPRLPRLNAGKQAQEAVFFHRL